MKSSVSSVSSVVQTHSIRVLGAALLLGVVSGCYEYVPVRPEVVPPTEDVRVKVTDAAAARLVKELGTYTSELDGRFAREGADSVSVSVAIARDYRGMALDSARQVLFLGPSEVVDVRRRMLSRGKTALVSAGAVVGFVVLVGTVIQLGDQTPPNDEPLPMPPPILAPHSGFGLRFRVPLPLPLPIP